MQFMLKALALGAIAALPASGLPVGALTDPTHPTFDTMQRPMFEFAGIPTFAHTPYVTSCFKSFDKDADAHKLIALGAAAAEKHSDAQKHVGTAKADAKTVIENLLYPKFDIAVVGIPFDTSVTYRPGARFGPRGIRGASMRLSLNFAHDPLLDVNPLSSWATIVDCGDVPAAYSDNAVAIAQMEAYLSEVVARKTADPEASPDWTKGHPRVVTLGGDHTIVLPILRALHKIHGKSFHVIHFDSHMDTWEPSSLGGSESGDDAKSGQTESNPYPRVTSSAMLGLNHGTPLWHAAKEGLFEMDGRNLHVGLRGKLVDMGDYATDDSVGFKRIHAADIDTLGVKGVIERIVEVVSGGNTDEVPLVYISLDIDVLDPAFAPATGTPEIGGWSTRELKSIIRGLQGRLRVIGADVVEVAPAYDTVAEQTTLAAAEVAYEFVNLMITDIKEVAGKKKARGEL
ncbi:Arginase/deacetylase [Gonapodya prolifera JEL478]|uniref:Arginase/deacetylase n=1 Tax=Gonapodya prolifera (strain JEL478) TaxID=1344416 RepID=A0A139AAR0_GONPJ|nr:Arginase/deacetylase [Gonapodya prolifera JEL478]|eukprot:KXS13555.1 Arginase/deacetylase [Gonapodya prolifera JEL478]